MPPLVSEEINDYLISGKISSTWVDGVIIVGAGPSGLATAACLQEKGVKSVILEKSDCIASLWQNRTYDRLHLHTPKKFCGLPLLPIPDSVPTYPTRQQFVEYVKEYARHFDIKPRFGELVQSASFDETSKVWRVQSTNKSKSLASQKVEYVGKWLVVATGENADDRIPELPGLQSYRGRLIHSSRYKNGADYEGDKVLVVGSGNSGMEIALDLSNFNAKPSIVVRSPVHVLPREVFGRATYAVAMALMKRVPLWFADRLLVLYSYFIIGNTAKYGIKRPKNGPLAMKEHLGRTPVLDVGTFAKIKSGGIKVMPAIESLTTSGARFVDGRCQIYDAIILATGYKCNVPSWLKGEDEVFSDDGFPKCGWKGRRGLYVAGLSKKGLLGCAQDARLIAEDIKKAYISG
ncbi:hypothetical protein O6H91_22G026200 [Diphasiastrum complanatum]|uniref:Uncharacterized protein n=1 Tax=Diphasiastrum complanatum TaxID=34168 RepID=A0ACC2ADY2_DIPCM|nr:hypothetical protein O6H91_Y383100 [Diphasiastrum complanatum]KAJ7515752.1 hypothetical protein O6H91_22G026200 [Diphasiastrum complanatum]